MRDRDPLQILPAGRASDLRAEVLLEELEVLQGDTRPKGHTVHPVVGNVAGFAYRCLRGRSRLFRWFANSLCNRQSAPSPGQHSRDGPGDDLEVEPERPAVDVLQILLDPVIELGFAAATDLPEPRHARLHGYSAAVPDVIVGHFAGERWTRSNQAHL